MSIQRSDKAVKLRTKLWISFGCIIVVPIILLIVFANLLVIYQLNVINETYNIESTIEDIFPNSTRLFNRLTGEIQKAIQLEIEQDPDMFQRRETLEELSNQLKNKNTFQWIWKYDSLLVILFLALLGVCMFYTFDKSWDCIQAVLNSSYPGRRVSTGGQVAWTSLLSGSNLFFPYRTEMIPFLKRAEMPVCEFALFMDFFPIGTLFAIYAMIKRKRVDSCLIGLFVISLSI